MTDSLPVVKKTTGNLPGAGPGRPKGVPNKTTTLLKDAILKAAEKAGGKDGLEGYLTNQAKLNPGPFMTLLGKVLPTQVSGDPDNPLKVINEIRRTIVDPRPSDG